MRMRHGAEQRSETFGGIGQSERRRWGLAGACVLAAAVLGAGCATAPVHIGEPGSIQGRTYVVHERVQDNAKIVMSMGGHDVPQASHDDVHKDIRVVVLSSGKGRPTVLKATYEKVKVAKGSVDDPPVTAGKTYTVSEGPGANDPLKVTSKGKPVDPIMKKIVLQDVFVREPGNLLALITKALHHPGKDYPMPKKDLPEILDNDMLHFQSAHLKADKPDSAGHARLRIWVAMKVAKQGFTGTLTRNETRVIDEKTGRYLRMTVDFSTTAKGSRVMPMGPVTATVSSRMLQTADFDYGGAR